MEIGYLLLLLLRGLDDQLRSGMNHLHLLHDGSRIAGDEYFIELVDDQFEHSCKSLGKGDSHHSDPSTFCGYQIILYMHRCCG